MSGRRHKKLADYGIVNGNKSGKFELDKPATKGGSRAEGIITTPTAWATFDGAVTYGLFMAFMCAAFKI